MRKTILALAAAASALVPALATAQTRELRNDRREIREGQAEVRRDVRRGDLQEAREDRRELREDRREYREDWREYRRDHQRTFRRGAYYAPRGYRYTPVRAGVNLRPAFYGNRYWINDPYTYRLPRPSMGAKWVRYGNDVVLVNVRTGRVLQVYRAFFY